MRFWNKMIVGILDRGLNLYNIIQYHRLSKNKVQVFGMKMFSMV